MYHIWGTEQTKYNLHIWYTRENGYQYRVEVLVEKLKNKLNIHHNRALPSYQEDTQITCLNVPYMGW
jgi:hypothetical protein